MWVLVILPILIGLIAVRAYVKFLLEADELIKKMHLEALAFGCGAGLIVGTGFGLFGQLLGRNEDAGAYMWIAILAGFSIGLYRASRRYYV